MEIGKNNSVILMSEERDLSEELERLSYEEPDHEHDGSEDWEGHIDRTDYDEFDDDLEEEL